MKKGKRINTFISNYKSKKKENFKQESQQVEVDLSEERVATPSPSLKPEYSPLIVVSPAPSSSPKTKYYEINFDGKIWQCPEDKGYIINPVLERHQEASTQQESATNQKEQCQLDLEKCHQSCEEPCEFGKTPNSEGKCYDGTCSFTCLDKYNCEVIGSETGLKQQYETTAKLKIEVEKYCQ